MSGVVVKRAYRYRCYPTDQQAAELSRTFGCVRLVYNRVLEARTTAWREEQRRVGYADTTALLTAWKQTEELAFLNEVSSVPLQQCLRHLQKAFTRFFGKQANCPRFKSRKKSRASAEYTRSGFRWRDGQLTLATMDQPLAIVWSRPLPEGAEPSTVTVSRDPAGRWHVSILVETTIDRLAPTVAEIGVDAGLTSLLTLSTGEKIANPKHEHRERVALARAQRNIVIEDLAVRNMVKNRSLARAISDASWSEFRSMLTYKAEWYGRTVVVVDRWYPSSKTRSRCGHLLDALPLGAREWTCPGCGEAHDRDVNAARNILAVGRAVTACGDGVRPNWR